MYTVGWNKEVDKIHDALRQVNSLLGGTHRDVFTVTSSYNLDLTAGPADPREIIDCTSEAPVPTLH